MLYCILHSCPSSFMKKYTVICILAPRSDQNDRHLQAIFSDAFSCKCLYFGPNFIEICFFGVQLSTGQHRFRQQLGAIQATCPYLNQCWPIQFNSTVYSDASHSPKNTIYIHTEMVVSHRELINGIEAAISETEAITGFVSRNMQLVSLGVANIFLFMNYVFL